MLCTFFNEEGEVSPFLPDVFPFFSFMKVPEHIDFNLFYKKRAGFVTWGGRGEIPC